MYAVQHTPITFYYCRNQFDKVNHFRCCPHPDIIPTEHNRSDETRKNTKRMYEERNVVRSWEMFVHTHTATHVGDDDDDDAATTLATHNRLGESHAMHTDKCASRQLKHKHK